MHRIVTVHTEGAVSRSFASRCSYKAPNENGNPSFATVRKVARAWLAAARREGLTVLSHHGTAVPKSLAKAWQVG